MTARAAKRLNPHHFVFAAAVAKTYPWHMPFRSCRRFVALITAALFMLSAVAHHAVAAGMTPEATMAMPTQAADMTSHDNGMPCPMSPMSADCSKDMSMPAMACFAHCATVLGILSEPAPMPVTAIAHSLKLPIVRPLAGLHGPPEPPPPKSHA